MASWRHISILLSALGLFTACAVFGMLFWMTSAIEEIERDKTRALIDLKVSETSDALRLGVEDYAFWTYAHDVVQSEDRDAILEDLGSGATASDLFDQLFILNSNGNLRHAFDETLGAEAQELYDQTAFGPMWDALVQMEPAAYQSVTSVLETNGGFSIAVAAWITPDWIEETPGQPLSVLIGVIKLNDDRLQSLITDAQISTVSLAPYTPARAQENPDYSTTLFGLNDRPVALLTWSMQSVGTALRQELLPLVIAATLCIVFICGSAARYFRSQHLALQKANVVATTDPLTGLLNRAGLAEQLRLPDVLQSLEKGHLAAIYLDLNNFKDINDRFGHKAGDMALRVTAERLQSAARGSDIVVRLGGDEFLCVVIDADPEKTAVSVAKRLLDLAASPISFGDETQVIAPAAGVAISTPGTEWETLLSQSDAAMFWAKRKNADHPILFYKGIDDTANMQPA